MYLKNQFRFRSPRQDFSNSLALDVGFIMDHVTSVRNLRHTPHSALRVSLLYVLDPVYYNFVGDIKLYKGDTLVIEVRNYVISYLIGFCFLCIE